MEFSGQERKMEWRLLEWRLLEWRLPEWRLPFPSPGDLADPGTEPMFSALADRFFITEPSGKPSILLLCQ